MPSPESPPALSEPPLAPTASLSSPSPPAQPEWITRAGDRGYAWAPIYWQRAAAQPGAWFDAALAEEIVKRWPKTFRLTTGRFAGRPFILSPWQDVIVRLLVGWKIPIEVLDAETALPTVIHVRLFRELRLWIARKNGKSEFLAALALLFWAIEGEVRGQGFCFARDEEQARVPFNKMGDMIEYAPALAKDIQVFAKALWIQSIKSSFRLLTGKAKGKHGRGATVTLGDEMHEWKSRELADTMRQSEAGSLQPIRLYASTASPAAETVGNELYDESVKILDGRIDDPTTLVAIFAVPDDADWNDERTWPLANPSLGLSPTLRHLREEYAKAAGNARAEAQFRCYHLNQVVAQYALWLPLGKWDGCGDRAGANAWQRADAGWRRWPDELAGRDCVLAFDSTKSFDPACLCLRFEPLGADEQPKFLWRFWMPQETIAARLRDEHVPFDRWRDAGVLTEIPGAVFVLAWAIKAAAEACQRYNVSRIVYDPWQAQEFYNRLVMPTDDDGVSALPETMFAEMRFGARSLGEASRKFEERVFSGALDHGLNPMARWMAGHCQVRFDENMNFVPAKKKSAHSIDGIVAAVMCEAAALAGDDLLLTGGDVMAVS